MTPPPRRRPISVEDLLRIKRAERPPPEFWTQWERQLHTKQLAAILDKRPWWRDAGPRLAACVARLYVPLGAAAVLTLTFLTVREYRSANTTEMIVPAAATMATPAAAVTGVSSRAPATALVELRQPTEAAHALDAAPAVQPGDLSRALTMLPSAGDNHGGGLDRPAAQAIAANLALVRATDPGLSRVLARIGGVVPVAVVRRPRVEEPLATVSTVREFRQKGDRLGYTYNANYATEASSGVTAYQDRQVSRLKNNQLYESASRWFDASGNSVSLRF